MKLTRLLEKEEELIEQIDRLTCRYEDDEDSFMCNIIHKLEAELEIVRRRLLTRIRKEYKRRKTAAENRRKYGTQS